MTTSFRKTDFVFDAAPAAQAGKKIVIAIDGPAAAGKGTLARRLAERLNYAHLDTGALYRAVGMATLEMGGNPARAEDALRAIAMVQRCMTPELQSNPALRTPEVSEAASKVAALPEIRAALLDFQRRFAANPPEGFGGTVLDGRDIGTVVCPDADIKFFITATPEERARRRFEELNPGSSSAEDLPSAAQVLEDLQRRDARDAGRETAPTKAAEDAYILDTTALTASETVEEAIAVIRARFIAQTTPAADAPL